MALYEEHSKKARILQREKRQELQLIIERCNKIAFEYVCIPKERTDNVVFGTTKARHIHLNAEDGSVNSFMRRCFKEHFPESTVTCVKPDEGEQLALTVAFASKVPRFQDNIVMDSSQVYRRKKKHHEIQQEKRASNSAFGMSSKRTFIITREIRENITAPSTYTTSMLKKSFRHHSFGGKIIIENAYDIVCGPKNLDSKCDQCECTASNIYWKNQKANSVLCRKCYNDKISDIKNNSRGVLERIKKLQAMEGYKKKRYCGDFLHQHNNTTAAFRLLTKDEFDRTTKMENFLNTILKY